MNIGRRLRAEASGEFSQRYAVRAGIEGTNPELKRAHGLGHRRVREGRCVRLAVYLKALACNIKRMVRAQLHCINPGRCSQDLGGGCVRTDLVFVGQANRGVFTRESRLRSRKRL
ncbi:transposase [Chloroflexota bacterium]